MKGKCLRYWEKLHEICNNRNAPLTLNQPRDGNKIGANLGPGLGLKFRTEIVRNARITGVRRDNIAIRISVHEDKWKAIEEWGDIREKFESEPQIAPVEKGTYKDGVQIILYKDNVDPEDESVWMDQFEWFIENLSIFVESFCSCFNFHLPTFPKPEGSKAPEETDMDAPKETVLSPEDLWQLRKISQDLQELLARYDN